MSFKAKNISFNDDDPPFLKKLQGNYDQSTRQRDNPRARPQKKVLDGDDDEPTYVDTEGNTLTSKAEVAELLATDRKRELQLSELPGNEQSLGSETNAQTEPKTSKSQEVGKIGSAGKRKIAKVIGDGDADETLQSKTTPPRSTKNKSAKKTKVKLSFDEE